MIENLVENTKCNFCANSDEFDIMIQESTKYKIYGQILNELNELEREIETDETYQVIKIICGKCGNIIRKDLERF